MPIDNHMDWVDDNACLSDSSAELERVFKYGPRPSRVIKIVSENGVSLFPQLQREVRGHADIA